MRIKKPRHASLEEVKVSRENDGAVIEFADPTISTTHFKIGPQVRQMSDQVILNMFNEAVSCMDAPGVAREN